MLKMNWLFKCGALALALVVSAATIVEAQQQQGGERGGQQGQRGDRGGRGGRGGFPGGTFGGGFGGGFGTPDKVSLLGNPQVQTELKIASEQKLFLDDIIAEHREKQRETFSGIDFSSFRDKSEEERAKIQADMQAKRDKLNKDAEAGLAEFLSDEQIKRLDEIVLQLRGLRVLTDDDTGKKLAITADQKKKIETVFEAESENRRKMFDEARGGDGNRDGGNQPGGRGGRGGFDPNAFAAMREKMEAARKKTEADVLAVLSADQKKQFDTMKGKPFELDRGGFGGPGGFGGGRPGGGRPGGGRPQGDGGDRPRRPAAE